MIITVTFTPGIERTFAVPNFTQGEENKASSSKKSFSGAGIDASRIVKAFGCDTLATGFIAGKNGRFIKDKLETLQIEYDFTEVPGQVGTTVKILSQNAPSTTIRESGFRVSYDDYIRLKEKVLQYAKSGNVFFIGSRLPEFIDADMYADLCSSVSEKGCPILVKAKKDLLKASLCAHPVTVCLTASELSELTGAPASDSTAVYSAAMQLIELGAASVMVSLGTSGVLYCSPLYAAKISAPGEHNYDYIVSNKVCLSAFACALSRSMANDIAACYAVAASVACSNTEKGTLASMSDITYIFSAIDLETLCKATEIPVSVSSQMQSIKFE